MIKWVAEFICIFLSLAMLSFYEQTTAWTYFTDLKTENATIISRSVSETNAIKPYQNNPFYWQYNSEPVLLIGGSDQDNLFNHPNLPPEGLEAHLDLLVSVGGNYIRNTMSSRDEGNVRPFKQLDNGLYDLDQWNTDYWSRLDNLLRLTEMREIIVQIEIWDPWDIYGEEWTENPWNPEYNVNYSTETSQLAEEYDPPVYADETSYGTPHDFFLTVPDAENNKLVLSYQSRFVEKLLSYTLLYNHILYTITNEIHPQYPSDWGWYWSRFIKEIAAKNNMDVYVTEMYWQPDMKHSQHKASLQNPDIFDYFEASQNSATLVAESHWENLVYVHDQVKSLPRPVNHTKMYGSDAGYTWTGTTKNVLEKFWRNIFAGAASARFHRPPAGIGLSTPAQRNLRSMRMLSDSLNIFKSVSLQDMITERGSSIAYIMGEPDLVYAVYFQDHGTVAIDLQKGRYHVSWLNINSNGWMKSEIISIVSDLKIEPPAPGSHVALIRPVDRFNSP